MNQLKQERLFKVVLGTYVSEKGIRASAAGQHLFKVLPDANKYEIKRAVEMLFEVKVDHVRTLNVKGKTKRTGKITGRRKDFKKAYVKLKEGYDIDLGSGE